MSLLDDMIGDAGINPSAALPQNTSSYGTPPQLLDNLKQIESSGNAKAINKDTGAAGAYQFLGSTVKMLKKQGIDFDPFDEAQSRAAADYYIQQLRGESGGDYFKALAKYGGFKNADPTNYVSRALKDVDLTPQPTSAPALGSASPPVYQPDNASSPTKPSALTGLALQMANDAGLSESGIGSKVEGAPENTTTQNVLAGIGHGMVTSVGNMKQGFDMAANKLESAASGTTIGNAISYVSDKLGFPTAQQALQNTNQSLADNKKYSAPLMKTTAGTLGDMVGQGAVLAPTALIPGVNTLPGAAAVGAGAGLATTEGNLKNRLIGAAEGGAGMVAGTALGGLLGAGASKLSDSLAKSNTVHDVVNASKNQMLNLAEKYGLKMNPVDANPNMVNRILTGISGKIQTNQAASSANQPVINGIIRRELGVPENIPLNQETLGLIRQQAGNAYNVVRNSGAVTPGENYTSALNKILSDTTGQAKSFPGLKNDEITGIIGTLNQKQFNAGDAVDATRFLRNLSDKAYAANDKQVGAAYKGASNALEDALDSHLQSLNNPNALAEFRNARQTIAKTYSVQKAMNLATGDIDAAKLAAQFNKGKPLSGGLKDVAQLANAFPKTMQSLKTPYQPVGPLDYALGVGSGLATTVGTGSLLGLLAAGNTVVRPAIRSTLLSAPVQKLNTALGTKHYLSDLVSAGLPMAQNKAVEDVARIAGTNYAKNRN